MKKQFKMKSKNRFLMLLLFAGGLLAASCEKPAIDPGGNDDPATDTTSTEEPGKDTTIVYALGVEPSLLYLLRSESATLSWSFSPETPELADAPVWSSDDESVATVSPEGEVSAVSPGKTVIRLAAGDYSAECKVTVFMGDKKPEKAYVGDYYLSDGSILSQNSSRAEIGAMDVIGVVFCTDTSRMSGFEKKALWEKGIEPNGLVMSAKQAPEPLRWYYTDTYDFTLNEEEIGMPNIIVYDDPVATYRMANEDLNGYMYYKQIKELRAKELAAGYYQVFTYVAEFEESVPSPEISTGWYLPSNGQWFDILRGLAKGSVDENNLVPEGNEDFYWMQLGPLSTNINNILEPVKEHSEFIGSGMMFWTSSVASPSETRFISLDDNGFSCCYRYYKMEYMNVLCVLGF